MSDNLDRDLLANLAAADYHDTTDPTALAGHAAAGCPCWTSEVLGAFAVRLLTGEVSESVLDSDVGVVVVPLDDITGTPDTGRGPGPGHPERTAEPLVQMQLYGEISDQGDAYVIRSENTMVRWHPWLTAGQGLDLLADAVQRTLVSHMAGRGVEEPT